MNRRLLAALVPLLLAACASPPPAASAVYDLGPLPASNAAATALAPLALAAVGARAALGGTEMIYRLAYANDQQLHPYANSRWSMAPPELFGQRLRARLAATGTVAANAADTSRDLPLLRVELEDFSQDFSAPAASGAHVTVRATLFAGRRPLAQHSVSRQAPAPSADAAGGARALAAASDLAIDDLLQWLATAAPKK